MAPSFSLSLNCHPLYNHHKTLFQGFPAWSSVGRKLQSSVTSINGCYSSFLDNAPLKIQLNWSNDFNRGIFSVNRSYFIMMTPSRNFSLPFSNHVAVSSSSYVIISGFWVGPDTDDGWGFVEALVHHE